MAWTAWQSVGTKGDLLWENPNPGSSFDATKLTLNNLSSYNCILIDFITNEVNTAITGVVELTNKPVSILVPLETLNQKVYIGDYTGGTRSILIDSDYKVTIGGYLFNGGMSNKYLIPQKVIGFKKSLTDV